MKVLIFALLQLPLKIKVALEAAVQSLPAVKLISIVDSSDKQVILSIVFN